MDPENVKAIVEWPSPRNIYEVRSFHGLPSFYRNFTKNVSSICAPIMDTIKREHHPFEWTKEEERGFILLKQKIQRILFWHYHNSGIHLKSSVMQVEWLLELSLVKRRDLLDILVRI